MMKSMKNMKVISVLMVVLFSILLAVCAETSDNAPAADEELGYTQISQEKAQQMMDEEKDYLIVDVRTAEEYAEGHMDGAVNVPNEAVESDAKALLKNKEQILLVNYQIPGKGVS